MKTKEQVLAIKGLTAAQKERAIAYFTAQERFKKPLTMPCDNEAQVKDYINGLQANYDKRKAAEKRAKEKKAAKMEEVKEVVALLNDAKKYGYSISDVKDLVMNAIREKKNAAILAQIESLKKQLI